MFRVLWLVIFAVACAVLTFLLAEKIQFLLSNPKSVNLDFNFNATLPFPAVTICNESPFK
jgi:Amiloride-sensitive sodium channel